MDSQLSRPRYQEVATNINTNPVKVVDYATGQERNTQQELQDRQTYLSQVRQSDQTRVTNAAQQGKGIEALAEFSKTLTERLVKDQDKKNKEEMALGISDEYLNPSDTTALRESEAELRAADGAIQQTASEAERNGLDPVQSQQIRNVSGWRAYGRVIGQVMRGAGEYPSFVNLARTTTTVTVTDADGTQREIGYHINGGPQNYEEKAAIDAQIRSDFLQQYSGINPLVLSEYLFPEMSNFEQKDATLWGREQAERIQDANQQEIKDTTRLMIQSDPGRAFDEVMSAGNVAILGGRGQARNVFVSAMENYLTDESIPIQDRLAALERLAEHEFYHNGLNRTGTFRELLPGVYNNLEDKANGAVTADGERADQEIERQKDDLRRQTLDYVRENGPLNQEEYQELARTYRSLSGVEALPDWITGIQTEQSSDDYAERERLDAIINRRGWLIENDLSGVSDRVKQYYIDRRLVRGGDNDISDRNSSDAKARINVRLTRGYDYVEGRGTEPVGLVDSKANAYRDYERLYFEYLSTMSPDEAHNAAWQTVSERIETQHTYYETLNPQPRDSTVVDRTQSARTRLSADPDSINRPFDTAIITEDELKEAENFVNNGKGLIPQIMVNLARDLGVDPYDVAVAQMQANGINITGQRPRSLTTGIDPKFTEILNRYPGKSTQVSTVVDVSSIDQLDTFTDAVASVESEAHGGYDAMNTGGTGIGKNNRATGSANSVDVFGRGLSEMTVGEVMALQSEGKVFAAGRYQFIPDTLRETVQSMGLSEDTPFNGETQDLLLVGRLAWRLDRQNNMYGLRTEWQGLHNLSDTRVRSLLNIGRDIVEDYRAGKFVSAAPEVDTTTEPLLVYTSGNIGPTSTGPHLDVKTVDKSWFDERALDPYVVVDDPEFGRVTLGEIRRLTNGLGDNFAQHQARGSWGIDYGLHDGTKIYLTGGATVVSSRPSQHGDVLTIQLPTGRQFTFIHGTST